VHLAVIDGMPIKEQSEGFDDGETLETLGFIDPAAE
jgi:hypothetical protein